MRLHGQIGAIVVLAGAVAAGWLWLPGWQGTSESGRKSDRRAGETLVLVEALALAEDRVQIGAIGTLDDRSSPLIEFDLPEEYTGRVRRGDSVVVRPWAMADSELREIEHGRDAAPAGAAE